MAGENLQERKRISEIYARAFYDLAADQGVIDAVRDQLETLRQVLEAEPELERVFDSVLLTADERAALLERMSGMLHPTLRSFLGVMNQRNRLGLLPEVIAAFGCEDDRRNRRVRVKLYTATPVDSHMRDRIEQNLREYLLKEPIIDHQIRPEILGGFVAQAGDFLIDGSVKTRLADLQKRLLMRGEDEIQS